MSIPVRHYNGALSINLNDISGHELETLLNTINAESIKHVYVDSGNKRTEITLNSGAIYQVEFKDDLISDYKLISGSEKNNPFRTNNQSPEELEIKFINSKKFQKPLIEARLSQLYSNFPKFIDDIKKTLYLDINGYRSDLALWEIEEVETQLNRFGFIQEEDFSNDPFSEIHLTELKPKEKPFTDEFIRSHESKAIFKLLTLSDRKILSRNQLCFWLIEFEDFYLRFKEYNSSLYNYLLNDKEIVRLPDEIKNSDGEWFLDVYSKIESFFNCYNEEDHLGSLISELRLMPDTSQKNRWYEKVKDKFYNNYIELLYNQDDLEIGHDVILVNQMYKEDKIEIYIRGDEMKNSIEFSLICFEYFEGT